MAEVRGLKVSQILILYITPKAYISMDFFAELGRRQERSNLKDMQIAIEDSLKIIYKTISHRSNQAFLPYTGGTS